MLEKDKKVGDYILVEKLGSGGYGEVWKAEKRTSLSISNFALKFFRPNEDEKIDLKSVRKEVETWQTLSGLPNVISVIEANIFENYVYIVSDFAEGGSLEQWLKENGGKANSFEEAVTITRQILHGLEGMHRAGFVHRDLKPGNILIKKGVVYLADFGLSREMKTHSQATSAVGTIGFMPPEAFDKKPTVSIHTDIWATGVILQKLLTGHLPFPQDEIPSLISAILMSEPEPMPETIPFGLREIVAKSLQKSRQDRFQWAGEMKDALRDALAVKETKKIPQVLPTENKLPQNVEKTAKLEIGATEDWRNVVQKPVTNRNDETVTLPNNHSQMTVPAKIQPQPTRLNQIKREVVQIPHPNLAKHPLPKRKSGFEANRNFWIIVASVILISVISFIAYNRKEFGLMSVNKSDSIVNSGDKKVAVTATPSNLPTTFKNSVGMEFIKILPGKFVMGSPSDEWQRDKNESPQREVAINYEFYLGKYEVTQEEYQKVTGNNPSDFKNCPRCPVEMVSWNDAKEFIAKLNAQNDGYEYRLPTEAEWEYAARAGTNTAFSIGDGNNLSSEFANFDGNHPFKNASKGKYLQRTMPVSSYPPNPWGLFDMNGNVWEWCEDNYQNSYENLATDGSANTTAGNPSQKITRGGAWINIGNGVRSAVRLGLLETTRLGYNGFRVAVVAK